MTDTLVDFLRIPAIGPENNGQGEARKAQVLLQTLEKIGFDRIEIHEADDSNVASGKRPNVIAYLYGKSESSKLWIITHLDVVPPGDESSWKITKPFEPKIKDGCVFGRGSEDNGQSLVASIYAAKTIKVLNIKPEKTFALAFVSDEEHGSKKGIRFLLRRGLFQKNDTVLVPDSGSPRGNFIEIAEKSILWFKIKTKGRQTHASIPEKGLNAHRIGMQFAVNLDKILHNKYNARNDYFTPPNSTFEPTRKENNVDAINVIPGEDNCYFDCRILPNYSVEEVLTTIHKEAKDFERKTDAIIDIEVLQKQVSPPLFKRNPEIVNQLKQAIKKSRMIDASVGGIGGGTCAAFFRQEGIPAVVWSTIDEVAHQADEYARISNMVDDAKIFALLATTG
jgi:succinyl-diaminopimelate desuccinylase